MRAHYGARPPLCRPSRVHHSLAKDDPTSRATCARSTKASTAFCGQLVYARPHTVGRHSGNPAKLMCSSQRSRAPEAVYIFFHCLRCLLMESTGESLRKPQELPLPPAGFPDRRGSRQGVRRSGFWHFPHRHQRSPAIVLFVKRPAHVPVEPVRVVRIDALSLLDPSDSFVDSAGGAALPSTIFEALGFRAIA